MRFPNGNGLLLCYLFRRYNPLCKLLLHLGTSCELLSTRPRPYVLLSPSNQPLPPEAEAEPIAAAWPSCVRRRHTPQQRLSTLCMEKRLFRLFTSTHHRPALSRPLLTCTWVPGSCLTPVALAAASPLSLRAVYRPS